MDREAKVLLASIAGHTVMGIGFGDGPNCASEFVSLTLDDGCTIRITSWAHDDSGFLVELVD